AVLLSPSHTEMVPRAELLLFLAARAQHVEETIRPALAAGRIVICDRFSDSTIAYQSCAGGLPSAQVESLIDFAASALWPDALLRAGFTFTKIASTGGFLREGNVTVLIGAESEEVENLLSIINDSCKTREQYVNVLPPEATPVGTFLTSPVKVQVGGAVAF